MRHFGSAVLLSLSILFELGKAEASPAPGTLKLKISKQQGHRLRKRDPVSVNLGNDLPAQSYVADLDVGTPPQRVSLAIDTGSSDIWMFAPNVCEDGRFFECTGGAFDESSSSSANIVDPGAFTIAYQDGSGVQGDYVTDVVSLGGTTIQNQTFAVADLSLDSYIGVFGVGYPANLVPSDLGRYPTVLDSLVSQGTINTHAYSLWLDDQASQTGTILFGGYDTSKYMGDLLVLPIGADERGRTREFEIEWSSLTYTDSSGGRQTLRVEGGTAILDSGTSDAFIPDDIFYALAETFGADLSYGGAPIIACDRIKNSQDTIDFTFGSDNGKVITVPVPEMAAPIVDDDGEPETLDDGSAACRFGVSPAEGSPVVLGDSFLRSAYVVYDLENNQIAIGQTNFNAGASDIQAIPAGGQGYAAGASGGGPPQEPSSSMQPSATSSGPPLTYTPPSTESRIPSDSPSSITDTSSPASYTPPATSSSSQPTISDAAVPSPTSPDTSSQSTAAAAKLDISSSYHLGGMAGGLLGIVGVLQFLFF